MEIENLEIQQISQFYGYDMSPQGIMILQGNYANTAHIHRRPFKSAHFSLLFCLTGRLSLKVNIVDCEISENQLLIIPPTAIREISLQEDVTFIALFFTPEYLFQTGFYKKHFEIFSFFKEDYQPYLYPETQGAINLRDILQLLARKPVTASADNVSREIAELLFQTLLLELSLVNRQTVNHSVKQKRSAKVDLAVRFLQILPLYYLEERELKFYADKLFVHTKYLSQTVKSATGKTPRQYIVEMIIMEAKTLLDNPKLSIGQISDYLRFSDQFHFSHFFTREVGINPMRYRSQEY